MELAKKAILIFPQTRAGKFVAEIVVFVIDYVTSDDSADSDGDADAYGGVLNPPLSPSVPTPSKWKGRKKADARNLPPDENRGSPSDQAGHSSRSRSPKGKDDPRTAKAHQDNANKREHEAKVREAKRKKDEREGFDDDDPRPPRPKERKKPRGEE